MCLMFNAQRHWQLELPHKVWLPTVISCHTWTQPWIFSASFMQRTARVPPQDVMPLRSHKGFHTDPARIRANFNHYLSRSRT